MTDHVSFVHAARLIAEEVPDARFVVVGEWVLTERQLIEQEITNAGLGNQFHLVGARSDIPAILNAADVVASTSKDGEGVQNSIIEAMSCGRPVVATDVGDASRVHSRWDSIVPVGDYRRVASEILRQLRQSNAWKSAERVAHAAALFDPERAPRETERLMVGIAARVPLQGGESRNPR